MENAGFVCKQFVLVGGLAVVCHKVLVLLVPLRKVSAISEGRSQSSPGGAKKY